MKKSNNKTVRGTEDLSGPPVTDFKVRHMMAVMHPVMPLCTEGTANSAGGLVPGKQRGNNGEYPERDVKKARNLCSFVTPAQVFTSIGKLPDPGPATRRDLKKMPA